MFASSQKLYEQIAQGKLNGFTAPAFNVRLLTYDVMRALFRAAKKQVAGAFIIELAQSEMEYTNQTPEEYAQNCQKAAKAEHFQGPIFLQADHLKLSEVSPQIIEKMEGLIKRFIRSGFYNIDIDCSALPLEQNIKQTAYLTNFTRKMECKELGSLQELMISIGGEVGEIGGENTTVEGLEIFLRGLKQQGLAPGIIKVAVQTGTAHGKGGEINWRLLSQLSQKAKELGLAGIVQHGASTLPKDQFKKFPEVGVVEIHLATEFMNIILESDYFPEELKEKMIKRAKKNNQPIKKALGLFKQEILNISQKDIDKIMEKVEDKFEFFFKQLNIANTFDLIQSVYNEH